MDKCVACGTPIWDSQHREHPFVVPNTPMKVRLYEPLKNLKIRNLLRDLGILAVLYAAFIIFVVDWRHS